MLLCVLFFRLLFCFGENAVRRVGDQSFVDPGGVSRRDVYVPLYRCWDLSEGMFWGPHDGCRESRPSDLESLGDGWGRRRLGDYVISLDCSCNQL